MKKRIFGAFIVVAYAFLMFYLPYQYYHSLVYLLGVFMVYELFKMGKMGELLPWAVFIYTLLFFMAMSLPVFLSFLSYYFSSLSIFFYASTFFSYILLLVPALSAVLLLALSLLVYGEVKEGFFAVLFFFVYITFGTLALAKLTKSYLALLISIVWATDTFAYLVGKYFGRRKLIPKVSPKKTLEGALGGSLFGTLAALITAEKLSLFEVSLETALLFFGITLFSQLGDLLESSLKRTFGVKDSGSLIPGHGGVLDRLDSTLAVAPLLLVIGGLS
jgi:phosphatidate cytidylyltransferase